MMAPFISGLEFNRRFYFEIVRSLLATQFPGLAHSAALIGYGSDVLGYDTALSSDHEWGPRTLLFLAEVDLRNSEDEIDAMLRRDLPPTFMGYSTNFTEPNPDGGWVRSLTDGHAGAINHHMWIGTVANFVEWELGVSPQAVYDVSDWLDFPEQKLLEVTAGAVFHDGLGQLIPLRETLAYYPHDVWLYRMAAQWQRLAEEQAFVGRAGDVGDDLGSRIIAARLARDVMLLCFLQERRYAPYSKWLGTAFKSLACAPVVGTALDAALAVEDWRERGRYLSVAYQAVARAHNALGVTPPLDDTPRPYYSRPYQVLHAERFTEALAREIREPALRRLVDAMVLRGAVDQYVDCVEILQHAPQFRRFKDL